MHWIERHILHELAVADRLTYTELLPDGVEGNLFQYHARQLEKAGLIIRSQHGYELTESGKQLVGTMSLTKMMRAHDQPWPLVMVYAVNEVGQTLLFHWRRQPNRGYTSLPFGRLIQGRSLLEMAAEQLRAKTGYNASIEYVGQISLQRDGRDLIISLCTANDLIDTLGSDNLTGTAFWGQWAEVAESERWPGQTDILAWITNLSRPALLELDLRASSRLDLL